MNWSRFRVGWPTGIIALIVLLLPYLRDFSTIVGPWAPYITSPSSSDGLNPKLLGMWHEKFQYPQHNGVVGFEGTIEYFRNRTYRINGLLKSTTFSPTAPPDTTSYRFDGNGEWQATDDELEIKLLDVKVRVATRSLVDMSIVRGPSPSAEESEIERGLLLAKSQRYDIRSTQKDEVVLETGGLFADNFVIKMNRTKQVYMK